MGNDNPLGDYLGKIVQALQEETVSLIDFDELSRQLCQAQQTLSSMSKSEQDISLLRRDYIERISGMAKAITAAEPHKNTSEELLLLCASLETAHAQDLITQYKRVSAKFRDAFPSSFGLLRMTTGTSKKQHYTDYK